MDIIVSKIFERGDGLKDKWDAFDIRLWELGIEKNILILKHKNVVVGEYLNRSHVYLNVQVTSVFASNFINLFQKLWLVNNENIKTNLNGLGQLLVLKT